MIQRHQRAATLVAALCAAFSAVAVGSASATAAPPPAAAQSVSYLGHQFTVPASWPIVDLGKAPSTCVRFDQHAVYLGAPGARQDCPTRVFGRTEALLIQPAAASTAPAHTADDAVAREFDTTGDGFQVTATYNNDRALAQSILASAALPAPSTVTAPRSDAAAGGQRAPLVSAAAVAAGSTDFTGQGFDACAAPDSGSMSAWKSSSPYSAVGVYIGGANRGCAQPNLTSAWVDQQASAGWRFLPIYVGLQGPGNGCGCATITSASQGTAAADDAVNDAAALGFPAGTEITYDMEGYNGGGSNGSLVVGFEAAWTAELHAHGYLAGVYGSMSSTVGDLINSYNSATMPDVLDFASIPGSGTNTVADPGIPGGDWPNHQRIHQYTVGHNETWGGTTLSIDGDYFDVQVSSSAPPPAGTPHSGSSGLTAASNGGYTTAWKGQDGYLWLADGNGASISAKGNPWLLGVAPNTTPSIATLSDGSWVSAWQGQDGYLWLATGTGTAITSKGNPWLLGVAAGTSPSIVAMPGGGWEVAWKGQDGYLWLATGSGTTITSKGNPFLLGVSGTTSPSLAALPNGGFQAAWKGNDGYLWLASGSGTNITAKGNPWLLGVADSPALVTMPDGSFEAAWKGGDGYLWLASGSGASITAKGNPFLLGVSGTTSPSLAALPGGGFETAWKGNDGYLWLATGSGASITANGNPFLLGVANNPELVTKADGSFEAAWKGGDGYLWLASGSGVNITAKGNPWLLGVA
ncbi:glycoside hydrolase domain-containing protein [Catenulispora pinisilvae]|uniref:glycoside hydrolase domain-containing protein n=1 Tax=Catenulispora pinisilvae TaxID=2705253 RepID=UPI001891E549|nr:glycoside hydrolase domain-containing protein [Catenulispora pinisilvae]